MAADVTQQQTPQAPPVPEPTLPAFGAAAVTPALLNALESCAEKAAGSDHGAEAKDFSAACLALAQAAITLDPSRLGAGAAPAAQANASPPQAPPTPPLTPKLPPTHDANRNGVIGG